MKMLIAALVGIGIAGPALAQAGGMALADFQATARTRLLQADTSGDGRITKAEWAARPRPAANAKADPARMFDRLDANRDGALDQAELDTLLARRFARMDANGDGSLTADERRAARERTDD